MQQYTNELTAEMLAAFDQLPFTAEQLAEMNEEARSLINERNAYNLAHPVIAAYLIATEGSLTRDGGTVFSEYNGQRMELPQRLVPGQEIPLVTPTLLSVAYSTTATK
jgi:hypothetical protein